MDVPLPVIRKCAPWEAVAFLETPPTTLTSAASGYLVMGYRLMEIAFGHSNASRATLLLLRGNVSECHAAPKSQMWAERDKKGSRHCCAIAAIAFAVAPIPSPWGNFSARRRHASRRPTRIARNLEKFRVRWAGKRAISP